MLSIKNMFFYGLLVAASTTLAAPTTSPETSLNPSGPLLVRRKNPNKCEAHIHIDSSNTWCGTNCTAKYAINVVDKAGNPMGYDFTWAYVGTWKDTNPKYDRIKIKTTKGLELWIDGKIIGGSGISSNWKSTFTLHYGSQHWNSAQCVKHTDKSARISNGQRDEYDLWCEFDC
ncbi:hypothetical protein BJ508DRAFT_325683 [Ascobolus immersus RN42]|uniref:Concanavalin A-like lectin/glucanase n=1 Tax=Ascobolus immersus RN42 TaxID=1160509 RepID=A0A3N4IBX0_ASCIM|nr:hypothetical protein BJ508DRAFT_325683 [Ascobolus immersus RN42]